VFPLRSYSVLHCIVDCRPSRRRTADFLTDPVKWRSDRLLSRHSRRADVWCRRCSRRASERAGWAWRWTRRPVWAPCRAWPTAGTWGRSASACTAGTSTRRTATSSESARDFDWASCAPSVTSPTSRWRQQTLSCRGGRRREVVTQCDVWPSAGGDDRI